MGDGGLGLGLRGDTAEIVGCGGIDDNDCPDTVVDVEVDDGLICVGASIKCDNGSDKGSVVVLKGEEGQEGRKEGGGLGEEERSVLWRVLSSGLESLLIVASLPNIWTPVYIPLSSIL